MLGEQSAMNFNRHQENISCVHSFSFSMTDKSKGLFIACLKGAI